MRRLLTLAPLLLAACGEPIDTSEGAVNAQAEPPPAAAPSPATRTAPIDPAPATPPAATDPATPAPAAAPAAAYSLPMRLVGTEPFWGGTIARDAITIMGADRPDARFPYVDPVVTGAGMRFKTQSTGAFPLDVTLVRETCSDGMSNKVYPFKATVVLGKETLRGCAIRQEDFGGER